ncbi:MAG: hypothetical protein ACKOCN_03535 [Planctomycetaceae bacterium]
MNRLQTRRGFLEAVTAVAAVSVTRTWADETPADTGPRKVGNETLIGTGEHTYRVRHNFPQLPERFTWQTTHGVAVDAAGNLYVIHEGRADQKDHPAIFVFDPTGRFVRAFGSQFQGGGHGIEIRREGSEEFLYVCGYQGVKSFAKLTTLGEVVWYRKAPMESGAYAEGEDLSTKPNWSRKGFLPTNFAFLDDGGFLLVDGYGSFVIHQFDTNARWVRSFGGEGKGEGTFNTPHGIWIDRRMAADGTARPPRIVVADRAHHTLQFLSLEGNHLETIPGFGLPANIDTSGNLMLVPELKASVTLLGPDDKPVARLGRAVERLDEIKNLRGQPEAWIDGEFVHPHDACFAADGLIYVAEWVATGRITRLERV